jgi:hypothetical protein
LNHEFVAIVSQLQPLKSTAVYHTSLKEPGCVSMPDNAVFKLDPASKVQPRGLVFGNFGKDDKPTHVMVVNCDYKTGVTPTITGPGNLDRFDPTTGKWSPVNAARVELQLQPGGGVLLRLAE